MTTADLPNIDTQVSGEISRIGDVIREVLRGSSISRAMQNLLIRGVRLRGKVIDLGARDGNATYYRFVDASEADITYCDKHPCDAKVRQVDLEEPLDIEDSSFDYVLLMHVLEHIYNTDRLLAEMRRICRHQVLIAVPFQNVYHPDPHDYFRFTEEALKRKLSDAGFNGIKIYPWGKGPFVHALSCIQHPLKSRTLVSALFIACYGLDSLYLKLFPSKLKGRGSLGFVCVASIR